MLRKIILLVGAGVLAKKLLGRTGPPSSAPETSPAPSSETGASESRADTGSAVGHVPVDLMRDDHPDGSERADAHFRPDPTGKVDAADRESLRPVTMSAPRDAPGL